MWDCHLPQAHCLEQQLNDPFPDDSSRSDFDEAWLIHAPILLVAEFVPHQHLDLEDPRRISIPGLLWSDGRL